MDYHTTKKKLFVIKIGGQIIDDPVDFKSFLNSFASIGEKKILIHGGGKLATKLAEQLNVEQHVVDGRRITDAQTLRLVTMVYAGEINKNIVAQLQSNDCDALGLTGADGNAILAHKRKDTSSVGEPGVDYGFAGDVDFVNTRLLVLLLENNITPVFAPLTHDKKGQLLNTNADTIARSVATAMSDKYEVNLVYSFEKNGVLSNAGDESSVIKNIDPGIYRELKLSGAIFAGMIPKLDNAFSALDLGVQRVIIGKAGQLLQLINGEAGTSIYK